ncbi:MAG: OsmC family protein [Candidatus Bathyarchaeia archaeon]
MTIMNVKARAIEDFRIAVDDGRAHSVCLDLPRELGTDMGPTALELGVMSFAGCVATIFVLMAKKMRLKMDFLEVDMKAEKPEGASTVTKADYTLNVKSQENEERIRRAFELTRENCPVGLLFEKAGVEVTFQLKIIK